MNNELIVKTGLVDKRKVAMLLSRDFLKIISISLSLSLCVCVCVCQGLFSKRRQLILTDAPRLYYIDPVAMELKGEIPW